jgi:hypothetical protein
MRYGNLHHISVAGNGWKKKKRGEDPRFRDFLNAN